MPKFKVGDQIEVTETYRGREIPVFGVKGNLDVSQFGTIIKIIYESEWYKYSKVIINPVVHPEYAYLVTFPNNNGTSPWAFAEDEIELDTVSRALSEARDKMEEEYYREAIL